MLARVFTATMVGLRPVKIDVEVDGNRGMPGLSIIGLPSKSVSEARERITSALQNCGIRIRSKRTVVNLAPADLPKQGSGFDLAIAVGLLKMYGEITVNTDDTVFFGELALDGEVKSSRGILPLVLAAQEMGFLHVVIPKANAPEVATISGITIHPIAKLQEYLFFGKKRATLRTQIPELFVNNDDQNSKIDFADIYGQEQAKRAMMIAAAGGHHILLRGSPGIGKTMLAQALPGILPPLTEPEAIEINTIYSICGLTEYGLVRTRPFRAPHHTATLMGLIGGGVQLRPGEISLAHRGVLFLDELLEFSREKLEALRQPLEEGVISLSRAFGALQYPASFLLVAAANPCPCGYKLSPQPRCHCTALLIEKYQNRLSGPLLDRIDLRVTVPDIDLSKFDHTKPSPINSTMMREEVLAARQLQLQRYQNTPFHTNAEVPSAHLLQFSQMTTSAHFLLATATAKFSFSARSYFKVIKVARTIADLENSPRIEEHHVAEALQYRE